ncbi:MAG: TetR/AcrR family transcriptional regulator [Pseudomonadota bacterium]
MAETATPQPPSRPLPHVKATRDDWLAAATDLLVEEGVERVKVLALSDRLSVSRSSFYWYFRNRDDLLDQLIAAWRAKNTGAIVAQCERPSATITEGVCNLFRCFVNRDLFDHRLDFAVREWARRSPPLRAVLERSDTDRVAAIAALFERHGTPAGEAVIRARIVYYMQIGYYALDYVEPLEARLAAVPGYLLGFTGQEPVPGEVAALADYARRHARGESA